ncbi:MAG TPA: formate--tetrahydrofolate ligase [Gammaproteobacteria bacterium]|nr:formate--tetrahydrofolate ligase [Xanthomonadales bacterium]MCB1595613.1 formate--tetrahydrofolate ligase [Xanthomonadales bacterium]HOP21786.1 formate--tetrahydrofolate ligase [Gammaproteobacteria bacterium]HPI95207.1 formate--tetrahydrofolate ligase [Gammaproteobacteria bacterium]
MSLLELKSVMLSNSEIAKSVTTKPIKEIASAMGINESDMIPYGTEITKVHINALNKPQNNSGKLILVSATTPTKAGEGKTTTSIGLAQGMKKLGESVCLALREPSLGPCMGIKGGATGGGYAQIVPNSRINLHFTGDFHAITSANNLISAMIDNHIYHRNLLNIDPRRIVWRRVMDMNDRSLRNIVVGLGGKAHGVPREGGFDITAASEIMAILCLSNDLEDLRNRLDRTLLAYNHDGEPIYLKDLEFTGSLMALLSDAIHPNLVQSLEGCPAFVHGGPFANIAHGCNSVIATKMAMHHSDWAITEAGFGFDLGAEKFFDIKCQSAGLDPAAVVLVTTVRALKLHGGKNAEELENEDLTALTDGLSNLDKHIESVQQFNKPMVVALNRFISDTDAEVELVRKHVESKGIRFAESRHFTEGGKGSVELAKAVIEVADTSRKFIPLYDKTDSVFKKIKKVSQKMYGAKDIAFTKDAERDLLQIKKLGLEHLPVCIAKAPSSLSDDPKLHGRPKDFFVTVRGIQINSGAGFLVVLTGNIMRMPGLPKSPVALKIELQADGTITGVG